jgi:hypothetical protein
MQMYKTSEKEQETLASSEDSTPSTPQPSKDDQRGSRRSVLPADSRAQIKVGQAYSSKM